jgi:hypothetical protein
MGRAGTFAATLLAGLALAMPAHADGLDDLKAALGKLQGTAPLRVTVTAQVTSTTRDDDEKPVTRNGTATVTAEDGPQGLRIAYARDVMVKAMAAPSSARPDDGVQAATRNALNELDYSDVHGMVHAAEMLLARLDKAKLKAEKADAWNGVPARLVSLELEPPRNQRFVDKQTSTIDIWIDATGRPLASRSQTTAKGSAFIVVSFETKSREDRVYAVVGDRLLVTRRDASTSGSGAGQRGDSKATVTLQVN